MFRIFEKKEQQITAKTLAEHLIAKIEKEYLGAATVTKWINWIGQEGISRAKGLIVYFQEQNDKHVTDADLANDMISKLQFFKEGVYFAESKNLRLLVVKEMCRYMGVDMETYRLETSREVLNRTTPKGLRVDPRHIEAEVGIRLLKQSLQLQSTSERKVSINK